MELARHKAILVLMLIFLCAGCDTENVELLPDSRAATDTTPDRNNQDSSVDAAPPDTTPPDTTPPCVCRFINCRSNSDCTAAIGSGSTCVGNTCTGGKGSCKQASDCGSPTDWACTTSPSSTTTCPP
jgi:hypothetical protein